MMEEGRRWWGGSDEGSDERGMGGRKGGEGRSVVASKKGF